MVQAPPPHRVVHVPLGVEKAAVEDDDGGTSGGCGDGGH